MASCVLNGSPGICQATLGAYTPRAPRATFDRGYPLVYQKIALRGETPGLSQDGSCACHTPEVEWHRRIRRERRDIDAKETAQEAYAGAAQVIRPDSDPVMPIGGGHFPPNCVVADATGTLVGHTPCTDGACMKLRCQIRIVGLGRNPKLSQIFPKLSQISVPLLYFRRRHGREAGLVMPVPDRTGS